MNIEFTNPIAVGDYVEFSFDERNQIGLITSIQKRKNYIIRKSVNLSHKSQVIASNIDLAFLIVTLVNPVTSLNFIDRFLVQAQAYAIDAKIIFNKTDLYDKKLMTKKEKYQKIYENIGYQTISTSIHTENNLDKIKKLLLNKVTVFRNPLIGCQV